MPRGDGTGPMGKGPMTGRGAGYCGTGQPFINERYGCGFGCGRGNRRQFNATGVPGFMRSGYNFQVTEENEKAYLSNQESFLENQLKNIRERISNLKSDSE